MYSVTLHESRVSSDQARSCIRAYCITATVEFRLVPALQAPTALITMQDWMWRNAILGLKICEGLRMRRTSKVIIMY